MSSVSGSGLVGILDTPQALVAQSAGFPSLPTAVWALGERVGRVLVVVGCVHHVEPPGS